MMWNWQQDNWPNFFYDKLKLKEFEEKFLMQSGELMSAAKYLSDQEKSDIEIDIFTEEAVRTSEIEGELLDRDSVRASIRKQLGLKAAERPVSQREAGVAELMTKLTKGFREVLSHEVMFDWHKTLLSSNEKIQLGMYRDFSEDMIIASGPDYDQTIHFVAPASKDVPKEMGQLVKWFNDTKESLSPIERAGIVHIYFLTIHPFEDGNGRIARALSEKAISQYLGQTSLVMLAQTILADRKNYYNMLEATQRGDNDLTDWLTYFANIVINAQRNSIQRIEFVIKKAQFYDKFRDQFNSRQEKVIAKLFDVGVDGWEGGLSADNYKKITKAPATTATTDLKSLVDMGALVKTGKLRYTRYFLNV